MDNNYKKLWNLENVEVLYNVNELYRYLSLNKKSLKFFKCDDCEVNGEMISFTDANHPVVINNDKIYLNNSFYNRNLPSLKLYRQKEIMYSNDKCIKIDGYALDNDFFNYLIKNKYNSILYFENNIDEEKKKILDENYIKAFVYNKYFNDFDQVSSNIVISNLTKDFISSRSEIYIDLPLSERDIRGLSKLKKGTELILDFQMDKDLKEDSKKHYKDIYGLIKILPHNDFRIRVNAQDKKSFDESGLLKNNNINFLIDSDDYIYKKGEYLNVNKQLDNLLENIKENDLSPYEKFIAAYNIVKQYKDYRESPESLIESRELRKVLKNDYIVCVGFTSILKELLNKLGIYSSQISVKTEISSRDSENIELGAHSRLVLYLKDEKYDIDGYYVSDPTWDNDLKNDVYSHSLRTFYETSNEKRLFKLENEDIYMGATDSKDFDDRISYKIRSSLEHKNSVSKIDIIKIYKKILNGTRENFYPLCDEDYNKIYEKYKSEISYIEKMSYEDIITDDEIKRAQKIYNSYLKEYKEYVLKKGNNIISNEKLLKASKVVKEKVDLYNIKELKKWESFEKRDMEEDYEYNFPYMVSKR